MGAAEIAGIQQQGIMSQAKHFIGYDTDATNVFIDPQTCTSLCRALRRRGQGRGLLDHVLLQPDQWPVCVR